MQSDRGLLVNTVVDLGWEDEGDDDAVDDEGIGCWR